MGFLPIESIPHIEEEIAKQMVRKYEIEPDTLLFDTSNFFTFIDSKNERCTLARRGHNKQKRFDLRQIGLALLVSRKGHLPLFHHTYQGNKNDVAVFGETLAPLIKRMRAVFGELSEVTLVFDKGNNSRDNFKSIDETDGLYYVAGLVPSYFKSLIEKANRNFETAMINGEQILVYRCQSRVWGKKRSCVVTVSSQLKEGQIRGIHQHLERKYKQLEEFKKQLENPRARKTWEKKIIDKKLKTIIKGQFVEEILKTDHVKLKNGKASFTYHVDTEAFDRLKAEVLGRKILVTNRSEWSTEDILLAYRGQAKVEYAFRNMKNPFHLAVRPQYHWTDQKIQAHVFTCVIAYLLCMAAYAKARKAGYKRNPNRFMEDLGRIRLACRMKKGDKKVSCQLEEIPKDLKKLAKIMALSNDNIRANLNISVYN